MALLAHIGNIPVEEWLPFTVPVFGLYFYGRYQDRKRRAALRSLPGADGEPPDAATVERVLAGWKRAGHEELSDEHVPLFYPPGPDGASPAELAARVDSEVPAVEGLLDDLAELGYLDRDEDGEGGRRVWLTAEGYQLAHAAEDVLLAGHGQGAEGRGTASG
jgi:hypothetical protein